MTSFDGYLTSIDLSFLKNDDNFAHDGMYQDNQSDLSDPDLFHDDAHLLDIVDGNTNSDTPFDEVHENVKALSLDEVPFDRDIRYINVAVGSRPRPQLKVFDGSNKRILNQINSATAGNSSEVPKLDEHYKSLDNLKKKYDGRSQRPRKPYDGKKKADKQDKTWKPKSEDRSRNSNTSGFRGVQSRGSYESKSHSQSPHKRGDHKSPASLQSVLPVSPSRHLPEPHESLTGDMDISTEAATRLRADAPEFVPTWASPKR